MSLAEKYAREGHPTVDELIADLHAGRLMYETFLRLFKICGLDSIKARRTYCEISTNEWIDDTHAGVHEIDTISRGDRQTVDDRRRRDEAVLDRHGFSGCAKTCQQFRPFQPRVRVPRKTMETPDPRVEPAFQSGSLPSL